MIREIQTELFNTLNITAITSKLANGSASIQAVSDFTGDETLPAILIDYAGGRWVNLTNLYEDWYIYAIDKDNGYYRIADIMEQVKIALHLQTMALTGDYKVFEIRWLNDAPFGRSRAFKAADTGGSLFRIDLSNSAS